MKHIIKTQAFSKDFLNEIFKLTTEFKEGKIDNCLNNKIICTFFSEESTRTRLSFESAVYKLNGNVISSANARQFSSISKGEILEDTIKVLNSYCDCIILRYHENNGAARAAHISKVPIINAGSGNGQHPTQSLLDLFTIKDELGQINGLRIALVGDLKHGRTIHSLAYLLSKFNNVHLYLVSPKNLSMPSDILDYLNRHNINYEISTDLDNIAQKVNVLYQTRIQKERFESIEEYENSKGKLIINKELVDKMLNDSIILHPMPRVDEITIGVDGNYRAKYFKQAENGLYVRMALLKYILQ